MVDINCFIIRLTVFRLCNQNQTYSENYKHAGCRVSRVGSSYAPVSNARALQDIAHMTMLTRKCAL